LLCWSAEKEPAERDLDSVELFAGQMQITRHMIKSGWRSVSYDKAYHGDESEDLCTMLGFENALRLVLRLRPHGSLWAAPVCSTWGFIGRSGTGRSASNAMGDNSVPRTRYANRMVVLTTMLMLLAYIRNAHVWIEQPSSSLMPVFSPLKEFLDFACGYSVTTFLQAFGSKSLKPLCIRCSAEEVMRLRRQRPHVRGENLATTKGTMVTGKRKQLRESQAYPPLFGKAVSEAMTAILNKVGPEVWFEEQPAEVSSQLDATSTNSHNIPHKAIKRPAAKTRKLAKSKRKRG
jgi:hypothetical protein